MKSFQSKRENMVKQQIASRGVTNELTLDAMRTVPREMFIPENLIEFAYEDAPLPIDEGQTISQPYIVAVMINALDLTPHDRVLEIGAGSGYAAAVLSRIVQDVYAVERHKSLADLARDRVERLGYHNVHILCGDGTLGWEDHATYNGIMVSAGGPEVPDNLLQQLAVGGRLVIPVGTDPRSQDLLRIRRTDEHEFVKESLGQVRFVPLIGSQGWSLDGSPIAPQRAHGLLRMGHTDRRILSSLIAQCCEPFHDIDHAPVEAMLDRIGDARVVLIGEASHGTSEFYRMRAEITKELITKKGFRIVAIEGDWPDTQMIDRYIRGHGQSFLRTSAFSRFPTWMWRNREMRRFVDWLEESNTHRRSVDQVSIQGLDLYSLNNSIGSVLEYLERVDPVAAEIARVRYSCFSPWEMDPATYGRAAVSGQLKSCEDETVETLKHLLNQRMEYLANDGDSFFDAQQNATVIREAERYYRAMFYGSRESWNLRDRHMFDTLLSVLDHRGNDAKAVVWAHNSHVGNAAATEMGARGEFNIGQLVREHFELNAYSIGFGTDHGTVAAASNWDEPMQVMNVQPSHGDSYERLCHDTEIGAFFLHLHQPKNPDLRHALLKPHLERAIGVIYRPETEILSHYFQAVLPVQFDEYIWFDETTAVSPLKSNELQGMPETYPFGL